MTMPWYFYATAVPVLYSLSNYIDKFLVDNKVRDPLVITTIAGLATCFLGFAIGLIIGFPGLPAADCLLLLLAGILLVLNFIPYYQALKLEDASRVVPLYQFIPVITLLLSVVILNESMTPKQITGMLIIVFAGLFLSAQNLSAKILTPRKSLWLMLLSSFMYGSVSILFRLTTKPAGFWTGLSYEYLGTGIGASLLLLIPSVRHHFRPQLKSLGSVIGLVSLTNFLSISALISESYAVTLISVPLVNLISGTQPIFSIIIGLILTVWFPRYIKEDISRQTLTEKLIAVSLIFFGLFLTFF